MKVSNNCQLKRKSIPTEQMCICDILEKPGLTALFYKVFMYVSVYTVFPFKRFNYSGFVGAEMKIGDI